MIRAFFYKKGNEFTGFQISGHALFGRGGVDIVCAAVSSAVQLTLNGVTEIAGVPAEVDVDEMGATIELGLKKSDQGAQLFLSALLLHLSDLKERYEGTIQISEREV